MRIPLPLKPFIEAIVNQYRADAIAGENRPEKSLTIAVGTQTTIALMNRFIEEKKIKKSSFEKPTQNNYNLKRFYDWLINQK